MEPRRASRTVIDPKVRQVGFFAPGRASNNPSPPVTEISLSGNSLSPVMIPPPRHISDMSVPGNLPFSPLRRPSGESIPVGSYNPSEFASPSTASYVDFREDAYSPGGPLRSNSGKFASSLPSGGFHLTAVKPNNFPASSLTTVSMVNTLPGVSDFSEKKDSKTLFPEKGGGSSAEVQNEQPTSKKSLKEKTSKAERRALQEAQRAAKAAAKGEGNKAPAATSGAVTSVNPKPAKAAKAPSQKKDSSPVAASEKKGSDRPPDKDRKKDVPHPRMQFDDKSRVEKAKKRAVVKQTEARNRVELFRHLPQYEHGTRLPDLESKFFQLDPVHPAVYKVGLRYLAGDISGGNSRCIAMLQAFQESIKDYLTPTGKALSRDLTAKINWYISFLIECRPLSISMGNAIRFLKTRIANLSLTLSESEAKAILLSDIDHFINEKIILADQVIVRLAVTKIRDGDVLLTYGSSSAVEMILLHAYELGKQFRVVVVDSRPKLEGQMLLRRLVGKGLSCTYTHINAVSFIMHDVTRVFLGASSVLSNGTVYSRVGTACVAMVAHAFRIPVLVCCETYKFHERVQLDSICSNELGDPDAIAKVNGREDINYLDGWANSENLQLLNLIYDATPSDYVSMIITDYGMVPPTSVPVIVREYRKEHFDSNGII
ncbi:probable translation initiation factor eIF-2B subunit delta isoform X1 [Cornus florida]|uniref:probable translation initiation factor eIF-2B subunit delta isoform X1 n=1 Tax=Cornus florida TaxID=4283 RepID=UPI00289C816B|nr:probable translation initiation factor eIF-2B subunit delta isoform X1 [Cornus florida]